MHYISQIMGMVLVLTIIIIAIITSSSTTRISARVPPAAMVSFRGRAASRRECLIEGGRKKATEGMRRVSQGNRIRVIAAPAI